MRTKDKDMQFIWTPTFNSTFGSDDIREETGDPNSEIFAHLLLTHYTPVKADEHWLDRDVFTGGNEVISHEKAREDAWHWLELFDR